jgi:hypothetical protein
VAAKMTCPREGETSNLNFLRKSTPMMGVATLASKKLNVYRIWLFQKRRFFAKNPKWKWLSLVPPLVLGRTDQQQKNAEKYSERPPYLPRILHCLDCQSKI